MPEGTTRGTVVAMQGADGADSDDTERYPPLEIIDLSPLPPAVSDEQGRGDPAAVARQWVGVKLLTSGLMDGPLWPYSVAGHLPALSDSTGQYLADASLDTIETLTTSEPDPNTARVTVAAEASNPNGDRLSIVYDLELWRSADGYWLVAFADVQ